MKNSLYAFVSFALSCCALTACDGATPEGDELSSANVEPAKFQPGDKRMLLAGQSNSTAFDDLASFAGEPEGGSVYYEVRSGDWNGGANGLHKQYADLLASKGKVIQVGVSWKDNPPGWSGTGDNGPTSRQVTQDIARGVYDAKFDALIDYMNGAPGARFLIRIDYEVSSYFHCLDESCTSYKDAFNHVAELLSSRSKHGNVGFIFHPVRGEFEKLYPGDRWVDWIGMSIFNHELCMPIHNQGETYYNGTPGSGFDTSTNRCKGYMLQSIDGNANAVPHDFDYDFNVLGMMKFAKDHGKPMIVSESAPMNFSPGEGADGTEPDALVATWVSRLFNLMSYRGPLPNTLGEHDLSGVIQGVVYIDNDLRYGWDGKKSASASFEFPFDADWYINAQLSRYVEAKRAFCDGLAANGFSSSCGGASGGGSSSGGSSNGGSGSGTNGGGAGEPGGGSTTGDAKPVPGVIASDVGQTSDGQTLTYAIEATQARSVAFRLIGDAPQSQLITTTVDGESQTNATAETHGGAIITSPGFSLSAGLHKLSVTVRGSGVSIHAIEAL